ncbi:MAG: hypothetical protein OEO79_01665 [Gemmatimonadota bacterium]|nr:hypothetical protein [Gemmatimonadota bacterium]MDH3422344.1 hypothetical protein [Gemmatimonadota bacterium]
MTQSWVTMRPVVAARSLAAVLVGLVLSGPSRAMAQGVVVDQGVFAVTLAGRAAGTEEFTIRRAGLNRDDALFATATVNLRRDGADHQVRVLLRATPTDGIPKCEGAEPCFQVDVEGPEALSLRLGLSGRRYVARIVHPGGEEIREFPAAAQTRVLEADVAHLYYFLKDVQEGVVCPVISPRHRERASLLAGPWVNEQIQLGPNVVQARRVEFSAGDDLRIVWFDRLGRVLRVSVPARGYMAQRTDLVG